MMTSKHTLIPVLMAIILIPQLLFWWVAPSSATARLPVYIGGTALTVLIPAAYFLTYWKANMRTTAGLAIVSGVLELLVIALAATLLIMDVTIRSAVYALALMALFSMVIMVPLIGSILRPKGQGVLPIVSYDDTNVQDQRLRNDYVSSYEPISTHIPAKPKPQEAVRRPLPPRRR